MDISIEYWVETALDVDSTELSQLIMGLPPSNLQSTAASLAEGPVESRVYALRSVSQEHSSGGDPEMAAALATIGIRLCERAYALYGPGESDTFLFGLGGFAVDAHRAYERMGRREAQLKVVEEALEWLEARDAEERYVVDVRFARIEALIDQGRLEEARERLDTEAFAGNAGHSLYGLLDHRIQSRLISATERKDQRSLTERLADDQQQTLKAALDALGAIAPEYGEALQGLEGQIDEQPEPLSPSEHITKISDSYQMLSGFMEGQAGGMGALYRLNGVIQRESAILAHPQQGYDPAELDRIRQSLEVVRKEALESGLGDPAVDTLWPLYLCYKRLERYDEALDALLLIRVWVNERRALIQDPLKRAGISSQYPYLYVSLSELLISRDDDVQLLSIIEEAKGRALADMLAVEAHQEGLLTAPELAANWLPGLMTSLNSHYVTFQIDDDVTYAVCVTNRGELHSALISIGSSFVEEIRYALDPSKWGERIGFAPPVPDDVCQRLSPLVEWLGELVDAGKMRPGDHICYAPDGLLHLVPLHYVEFRGAPFVKFFSTSRTHSATLLHYFTQQAILRPARYVALKVPLATEVEDNPEKVAQLGRVPNWFEKGPLPGVRLDDEKAELPSLAAQDLTSAVVHFATHGYFPGPREEGPYYRSGLVLSADGQLPRDAEGGGLLSPERIIEQGSPFDFDGSHVTLQACVSGLSEEGVGGDSLGPEWSFLMAGAHSVLSTHWNVLAQSSADFSTRFYQEWLFSGLSRAEAWRNAVLSQMDETRPFEGDQAYNWAAFSLAGDWR